MKINDHSVFWFFPFQYATDSDTSTSALRSTLGQLKQASWCARSQPEGAPGSETPVSIWEPENLALKPDLLPHVTRLLGMYDQTAETSSLLAYPPLKLTDEARGVVGNRDHHFGFALSKSAARRMALPALKKNDAHDQAVAASVRWVLPFKFESARIFRFGTGTGLLVLEIAYKGVEREDGLKVDGLAEIDPNLILEGNHLLGNPSRGGEFLWRSSFALGRKADGFIQNPELSLTAVARTLLEGVANINEAISFSRLYSYSAVTIKDGSPDEFAIFACRLARRYTTDYAITPNGFSRFSPFSDVLHVAEYEGSASLADCTNSVEFLGDYLNKVVRPTLLPMLVLAQHEHNFLLHLMETCSTGYLAEKSEGKRAEFLSSQRAKYLDYRLNYRFDYAARLTPQNGVYQFWRTALRADEIVVDLDKDLASIAAIENEKYLARQELEAASKHRWEAIKVAIMSGVGVYLVVSKIAEPYLSQIYSQVISCLVGITTVAISWHLGRPVEIEDKVVELVGSIKVQ